MRKIAIRKYDEAVIEIKKIDTNYQPPEIKRVGYTEDIKTTITTGACYIATAVYGSYEALAQSLIGRIFIKVYYTLSPPFAKVREFDQTCF